MALSKGGVGRVSTLTLAYQVTLVQPESGTKCMFGLHTVKALCGWASADHLSKKTSLISVPFDLPRPPSLALCLTVLPLKTTEPTDTK